MTSVQGRASACSSRARTPPLGRALFVLAVVFFCVPANAADSKWLPSVVDSSGSNGMCANDYKFGTTRIVQCAAGVPTTTSIAFNTHGVPDQQNPNPPSAAPKSWVSVQDYGISLVSKNGSVTSRWGSPNAGWASTNWGGSGPGVLAQAHSTFHGDKQADEQAGASAVRSNLEYGYISYAPVDTCTDTKRAAIFNKTDAELIASGSYTQASLDSLRLDCNGTGMQSLGYNQFFTSGGGGANYYLNGCPNYVPGQTSANMNYTCPRVPMIPGSFKFSILGLLFGSMINSDHNATYPTDYAALSDPTNYRDLAQYKSLVLSTTLDITNVGANLSERSAWVAFANGTEVNFTNISSTTNIANATLHMVSPGSGEDEIKIKFTPYYSTGNYSRDLDAFDAEFPGTGKWCTGSGGMEECMRDLTGFDDSPDSFPFGANYMVKKMGKGGLASIPENLCNNGAANSQCDLSAYDGATQSPASTREELAGMAGAPKLDVTEVRAVKIYMRKHGGCVGRPLTPAGSPDGSGMKNTTWPGAPEDCPYWFLASEQESWTDNQHVWKSAPSTQSPRAEEIIDCEPGDLRCYIIDVHLELEDEDGTRTVLGNPENDAGSSAMGWAKGTFFMYDPEINTGVRKVESSGGSGDGGGSSSGGDSGSGSSSGGDSSVSLSAVAKYVSALVVAIAVLLN
jgi:hypothetical protein